MTVPTGTRILSGDPNSRRNGCWSSYPFTAHNGDVFVAESHDDVAGPHRIVKFSADGTFIKSWGQAGSGPGELATPHGLAMDSQGRIFVAARGNRRIQIFDQEGNYLDEWRHFSRADGLYIDADDVLYASDSGSSDNTALEYYYPGWRRGVYIGNARDGTLTAFIPARETTDPEGSMGEGVTADADGNVYTGMVTASGVGAPPGIARYAGRSSRVTSSR